MNISELLNNLESKIDLIIRKNNVTDDFKSNIYIKSFNEIKKELLLNIKEFKLGEKRENEKPEKSSI